MTHHVETTALITGAAQGLGLSIAKELIGQGCRKLVLTDINPAGKATAEALNEDGVEASFIQTDMGMTDAAIAMVDEAAARMGTVTALVNAAGNTERGSILDTTPDHWDRIHDANSKGPFFALQRFAQLAIENKHAASAVNILSIVVHGGLPFLAPYGASKAALLYTTKNSANTLAKHHIRVNGINVGWMDTPGEDLRQRDSHDRPKGWLKDAESNVPFGKLVKPEEVATLTAFLLGPQSGVMTGSIIDFDQQVVGAYPDTDKL